MADDREHAGVAAVEHRFRGEAGLAYTRLAADQDERAAPLPCVVQGASEPGALRLASNERGPARIAVAGIGFVDDLAGGDGLGDTLQGELSHRRKRVLTAAVEEADDLRNQNLAAGCSCAET